MESITRGDRQSSGREGEVPAQSTVSPHLHLPRGAGVARRLRPGEIRNAIEGGGRHQPERNVRGLPIAVIVQLDLCPHAAHASHEEHISCKAITARTAKYVLV